ncbi:MAG: hypothetical protein BWK78_05180 [Thiotrichaceae bacterium IS1]|nr:MAG: hypothetical protein BWK78_05180 [Thiotrichaceae bacterium IS1]
MNTAQPGFLAEHELIEKALQTLTQALGPLETMRFLQLKQQRPLEAVEYHRQWQDTLDEDTLFEQLAKETEQLRRN